MFRPAAKLIIAASTEICMTFFSALPGYQVNWSLTYFVSNCSIHRLLTCKFHLQELRNLPLLSSLSFSIISDWMFRKVNQYRWLNQDGLAKQLLKHIPYLSFHRVKICRQKTSSKFRLFRKLLDRKMQKNEKFFTASNAIEKHILRIEIFIESEYLFSCDAQRLSYPWTYQRLRGSTRWHRSSKALFRDRRLRYAFVTLAVFFF